MTTVLAGITMSVDGYITGPNDGPGNGLGDGGERLHWWVFGGPWTYDGPRGGATGEDAAYLADAVKDAGAVVVGRGMYEAAAAGAAGTHGACRSSSSPTVPRSSRRATSSSSSTA